MIITRLSRSTELPRRNARLLPSGDSEGRLTILPTIFVASPFAVMRVTFSLEKGGVRFERHHITPATDKPSKPISAIDANMIMRARLLTSAIAPLLNAVCDARKLSVDCPPGRIAVCISNEDDSAVSGCVVIGLAAPLGEAAAA